MMKDKIKKARWYSTIIFSTGLSISQYIYSKDVIAFARISQKTVLSSLNKQHSYVLPYIMHEARKQKEIIKSVTLQEVKYDKT